MIPQETKDLILKVISEGMDKLEYEKTDAFKLIQSIGSEGQFIILGMQFPDMDPIRKEILKDSDNSDVKAKFESL